jgi:hypothetical protein
MIVREIFSQEPIDIPEMFGKFLPIAMKVLKISKLPKIQLEAHIEDDEQPTFGRYVNDEVAIHLALSDRHPVDILRTLAHELVHFKQHTEGRLGPNSGETGSPEENQAHEVAGVIMRHFNKMYPVYLKSKPLVFEHNKKINERRRKKIKKAAYGPGLYGGYGYYPGYSGDSGGGEAGESIKREFAPVGSGGDKPPRGPKNKGRDPWDDDNSGEDPYSRPDPRYYERSIDYFGRFEADHFDDEVFDKKSGVFKGYWDDDEGRVQIAYFKFDDPEQTGSDDPGMGWYYEPQNEDVQEGDLIPWPKGTVKVDVSDVYDWYKLGQHISNLKGLGKHDFGKGPPQTVISFGSEPLEHKYLKYLKQLGLDTHDIDENFADGKNPQDKGDAKRHGVPTKASVSTLRKVAKQGGRKGQLAHWMANMKAGRKK